MPQPLQQSCRSRSALLRESQVGKLPAFARSDAEHGLTAMTNTMENN
jgi:hypothetical protein